jgi:hypothetical protein
LDALNLYTLLVLPCLRVRKTVQEKAGVTVGEKVERRWGEAKVIVETYVLERSGEAKVTVETHVLLP